MSEWKCELDDTKCNSRQEWNNDKRECDCKKPIKYCACEQDYARNPTSLCACECDKDCQIGEYLKECE